MLPFSSQSRCGDQFVQQNSSERVAATLLGFRTPPKPCLPTDSSITEVQCNSHIEETSNCTPAPLQPKHVYLNNRQREHTESQLPPLPTYQSLRHLRSFSSPDEPPDTDPALTRALWSDVTSAGMKPSSELVPTEEYDLSSVSSSTFSEVLRSHQVTIMDDLMSSKPVIASFWQRIRDAVEATPAEVVSELEGCKVWEDNDEGIKAKAVAKAEDLAARLEALLADSDSAPIGCYQFITCQILASCPLPGVRLHNNLKMFDVDSEPYHLISNSRFATQPIVKRPTHSVASTFRSSTLPKGTKRSTLLKGTKHSTLFKGTKRSTLFKGTKHSTLFKGTKHSTLPKVTKRSTLPKVTKRSTASQNAAQPTKIDPIRELSLPRDTTDCAYWLEASKLQPLRAILIARKTFVSNGTNGKTSPYLSIAFDRISFEDSERGSFKEKQLLVKHKIAVYGSTALYNRHLLYSKALKMGRNGGSSIRQVEKNVCILHFGLAIVGKEVTLYMFQCEEENPKETDQATPWQGCNMSQVGQWTLTAPDHLVDMFHHLQIVADWVKRVYVPVLHDDLTRVIQY